MYGVFGYGRICVPKGLPQLILTILFPPAGVFYEEYKAGQEDRTVTQTRTVDVNQPKLRKNIFKGYRGNIPDEIKQADSLSFQDQVGVAKSLNMDPSVFQNLRVRFPTFLGLPAGCFRGLLGFVVVSCSALVVAKSYYWLLFGVMGS